MKADFARDYTSSDELDFFGVQLDPQIDIVGLNLVDLEVQIAHAGMVKGQPHDPGGCA